MSTAPAPLTGTALRWTRALAVATTAWCTASAAHVAGGGRLPALPVVLVLLVLTAWPLTFGLSLHGRAGRARLMLMLSVGQIAMHAAFVLITAWSGPAALESASTASGHGHSMSGTFDEAHLSGAPVAVGHTMSLLPSPMMLLAHLVAAVLLGGVLALGDQVLFSVLGLLRELARPVVRFTRPVLRVLAALLTAESPPRISVATTGPGIDDRRLLLPQHVLVRSVLWRGPPTSLVSSP